MSTPVPGPETLEVPTPHGPGRLTLHRAVDGGERTDDRADDRTGGAAGPARVATLLLSHGAGAGTDTHDLRALAERLPAAGVEVALLDQPWRVAGRRLATAPPTLDDGLRAAAALLAGRPLLVGGRSAGARSAARCARDLGAAGCLALAFPLHPPGRPERSRLTELLGAGVPTLVCQGERDASGRPEELRPDLPPSGVELVVVPDADHGLHVPKRSPLGPEGVADLLVSHVASWVRRVVGAAGTPGTPGTPR
ncbi:hypothetical protein GCM10009737_36330 [Nocardioides lentus]|uniref:KANL3/Tex30 alpha/beta hydrolase-like domain-containing protein n=1 Tax=Nocardioides lentus TaxID=338077 RepID=A0ABP5B6H4_9ACTN